MQSANDKLINVKVTCEAFFLVWRAADVHCYNIYGGNVEFECHLSSNIAQMQLVVILCVAKMGLCLPLVSMDWYSGFLKLIKP